MMKKNFLPFISFVALIFLSLSFGESKETNLSMQRDLWQISGVDPHAVELPAKRTQMAKAFLEPDGTETHIVSIEPVHYQKDGAWYPIDTRWKKNSHLKNNIVGVLHEAPKSRATHESPLQSEDTSLHSQNGRGGVTPPLHPGDMNLNLHDVGAIHELPLQNALHNTQASQPKPGDYTYQMTDNDYQVYTKNLFTEDNLLLMTKQDHYLVATPKSLGWIDLSGDMNLLNKKTSPSTTSLTDRQGSENKTNNNSKLFPERSIQSQKSKDSLIQNGTGEVTPPLHSNHVQHGDMILNSEIQEELSFVSPDQQNAIHNTHNTFLTPHPVRPIIHNNPIDKTLHPTGYMEWQDCFGEGIDFIFSPNPTRFVKLLNIDQWERINPKGRGGVTPPLHNTDQQGSMSQQSLLPERSNQSEESKDTDLHFAITLDFKTDLEIWADGKKVLSGDMKLNSKSKKELSLVSPEQTMTYHSSLVTESIIFKNKQGETLWTWKQPWGKDANGDRVLGKFLLHTNGLTGDMKLNSNSSKELSLVSPEQNGRGGVTPPLHQNKTFTISVLFPHSWLKNASYPIQLDPEMVYIEVLAGGLAGIDATYSTARSTFTKASGYVEVGQNFSTGIYSVVRGFLKFDTSHISRTPTTAKIYLNPEDDGSTTDFTVRIHSMTFPIGFESETYYDNALTSDYITDWRSTSGIGIDNYYPSEGLPTSLINLNGYTDFVLLSDEDVSNSPPAGGEFVKFHGYISLSIPSSPYLKLTFDPVTLNKNLSLNGVQYGSGMVIHNETTDRVIDWSHGNVQHITLENLSVDLEFANGSGGVRYILAIKQDNSGSQTLNSWPNDVRWGGDNPPTLSTTANSTDYFGFVYNSEDQTYDGIGIAQDFNSEY